MRSAARNSSIMTPIADRLRLSFAASAFASVVSLIPGVFLFRMAGGFVGLIALGGKASPDLLFGVIADGTTAILIILAMTFGLILPKMGIEHFYPRVAKPIRGAPGKAAVPECSRRGGIDGVSADPALHGRRRRVALRGGHFGAPEARGNRAPIPVLAYDQGEFRGEPSGFEPGLASCPGSSVRDHPQWDIGVRDAAWRDVHARSRHSPARRGHRGWRPQVAPHGRSTVAPCLRGPRVGAEPRLRPARRPRRRDRRSPSK